MDKNMMELIRDMDECGKFEMEKFYKEEKFGYITSSDTRFIFPGDLRVAGRFYFLRSCLK